MYIFPSHSTCNYKLPIVNFLHLVCCKLVLIKEKKAQLTLDSNLSQTVI